MILAQKNLLLHKKPVLKFFNTGLFFFNMESETAFTVGARHQ
jgi:hypothetical protein